MCVPQAALRSRGRKMIVDEVQTGVGASGTMWMHEQWALPHPPDVMTFSKKMQAAGRAHASFRTHQSTKNMTGTTARRR